MAASIPISIPHREKQQDASLNKLTPAEKYNQTYIEEDNMPPRRVSEEFDETEERHNFRLAMTAMARAYAEPKNGTKTDAVKSWLPMVTMAVLAFGFVRYDTTRENKSTYELADLRAKYEQSQVENRRYQNNVLMIEAYQRELERALIQSRVSIKLPAFPVLQK